MVNFNGERDITTIIIFDLTAYILKYINELNLKFIIDFLQNYFFLSLLSTKIIVYDNECIIVWPENRLMIFKIKDQKIYDYVKHLFDSVVCL